MFFQIAKMDFKSVLAVVMFASIVTPSSSSGTCDIRNIDYSHCSYTVTCITNPTSVNNPNCDADPYVIFIIRNSNLEYSNLGHLTTGFFASTNFDSRVREITGVNNSWTNIDTAAFRYYTKCIRLDISNNNIVKINNEAFKQLYYLSYLNVSYNKIESFYPKSFLISDSRNNALQELDLSNNNLKELSSELNELPGLKKLHLQNNMLANLADDAFMNLKNLNYLNLQNNRLTFLNLTLTNLKMLNTLDISNNYLIKLSGYEINRLVAMVTFNASHNALVSVESNCFNQAFSLETVDFSYNKINMSIENVMFINNDKLKYLNFYDNLITGVQENAFKYCKISNINFENNNFTGDIKENTLTGLRNITKLDLSRQSINSIRNHSFVNIESLLYLNLSTNNIDVVENSSFSNTSITVLDLSHNKVTHLFFLKNSLLNLTELYMNNNNITAVSRSAFDNQQLLKKLDLSMNMIKSIDQYSLPLINLQYLNIIGNRLNGIITKNVFNPARYLRFLDLSNFNITKIDESAFVDLPVLARLNLSNNYIETIDSNNFKGVDNLYSLDISHNNLTDLTLNNSILTSNLKALYLNNNNLKNVSTLFSNKCKLLYLDLSNNKIYNLTKLGADILPNLTVLHLANNNIINFNNPKVNSLTTLIDLGLSSNKISNINLSYFKELMSVDISNNNLTILNSTSFKNNEYLQSLDVSRNNISDLPPGTFQYMKNLKLLNFSSNCLTKLRYGSLKGLHKTELLDLSRNHITELDVDVFHECNDLQTLIIDYNRIKTFDVERLILMSLRKLRILSLGGNPISCKQIVLNVKSANVTYFALRQVEVTSIDKIYHEDNVHGIKCGDDAFINESTTMKPELPTLPGHTDTSNTSTSIVLAWCSLLTLLLIAAGVLAYIKLYKKRVLVIGSNVTMQMRNSLELDGSDIQSDLLS